MAAWYNNKWQEANQVTVYERGRCLDVRTRDKNSVSGLVQYVTSSVFEWNICSAYSTQIFHCLFTILGVSEVFIKLLTAFGQRNRKGLFDYSYLIRISLLRTILILFELFHLSPGNYAGSCLTRGSLALSEELIKLLI